MLLLVQMGDLKISPAELRARRGDLVIELSPRDVRILQLLNEHAGKALDRNTIFRAELGEDYFSQQPNSGSACFTAKETRVESDPANPLLIKTVHGVGYRYDPLPPPVASTTAGEA
ncbi:MAG: winged helix-turn-helix domain-containing protein [Planctomycetaceae bacterium]